MKWFLSCKLASKEVLSKVPLPDVVVNVYDSSLSLRVTTAKIISPSVPQVCTPPKEMVYICISDVKLPGALVIHLVILLITHLYWVFCKASSLRAMRWWYPTRLLKTEIPFLKLKLLGMPQRKTVPGNMVYQTRPPI